MTMTKEQEEIYHKTIDGLMKKLEERDELISMLRYEIGRLRGKIAYMEDEIND